MNTILKRVILSFCLLLAIFCVSAVYFYIQALSTMTGDSIVTAFAWIDSNGNGVIDAREPPLEGVCVWASKDSSFYNADQTENICAQPSQLTNAEGEWSSFSAGRNCDGWYFFSKPPTGYDATTALGVKGCTAQFGFIPEGTGRKFDVISAAELVQRTTRIETIQIIRSSAILFLVLLVVVIIPIVAIRPSKEKI
jgi:hypothetical protein